MLKMPFLYSKNYPGRYLNATQNSGGRFCNMLLKGIVCSTLSEKANIKFDYDFCEQIEELGIDLFKTGTETYESEICLVDELAESLIQGPPIRSSIICAGYYQTPFFANYFYEYVRKNQEKIIFKNRFKERYNSNNDVFVHVRLDDTKQWTPGFDYYDTALSKITFEKGYISSDSMDHEIVKELIKKWNLISIEKTEVETIMFGSSCRNIITSYGSFSFSIAVLGFFSKIFYPPKRFNVWCGDIFGLPSWTCVDS